MGLIHGKGLYEQAMEAKRQQTCSTRYDEVEDGPVEAISDLAADLHALLDVQSRAIQAAESLSTKLFGPDPKDASSKEIHTENVAAQISLARRQAEVLYQRILNLNKAV